MGVPISLRGRLIGAIYLSKRPDKEPFAQDDEEFVTAMGAMAAVGITNARSFAEETERAERTALLQQIAWSVRHSLEITEVLTDAVETIGRAAKVDRCYIRLVDEDGSGDLGPVEVEWDAPSIAAARPGSNHEVSGRDPLGAHPTHSVE